MEWYMIAAIILIIILFFILGMLIACILAGQGCTVSFQRRKQNQKLTAIEQEKERKQQKKLGSKFKRFFSSSSQSEQPVAPIEDIETRQISFKFDDNQNDQEQIKLTDETPTYVLPDPALTEAERKRKQKNREKRQKMRETIRKQYNL
jgi:predicted membrane protein